MELNGIEVDLINRIAKKYRKPLESKGDWYEFKGKLYLLKSDCGPVMSPECIPVWTVADCLKFVTRSHYYYSIYSQVGGAIVIEVFILLEGERSLQDQLHGGTLLEACLLAVLIILQDNEILKSSGIIRKGIKIDTVGN